MIVAQGGSIGGWSLYAKEGVLTYCYNFFGIDLTFITADTPIPAGTPQVRMEFAYDGGGFGKGGAVTLYYSGQKVGEGRVEATVPNGFSADETCDVGREFGSPVSPDYGPQDNAFDRRGDLGADRPGGREPGPPDLAGGALPARHGQAVAASSLDGRLPATARGECRLHATASSQRTYDRGTMNPGS